MSSTLGQHPANPQVKLSRKVEEHIHVSLELNEDQLNQVLKDWLEKNHPEFQGMDIVFNYTGTYSDFVFDSVTIDGSKSIVKEES